MKILLLERTKELLINKEIMKTSDQNLNDKLDAEINKYREKVKILKVYYKIYRVFRCFVWNKRKIS